MQLREAVQAAHTRSLHDHHSQLWFVHSSSISSTPTVAQAQASIIVSFLFCPAVALSVVLLRDDGRPDERSDTAINIQMNDEAIARLQSLVNAAAQSAAEVDGLATVGGGVQSQAYSHDEEKSLRRGKWGW